MPNPDAIFVHTYECDCGNAWRGKPTCIVDHCMGCERCGAVTYPIDTEATGLPTDPCKEVVNLSQDRLTE